MKVLEVDGGGVLKEAKILINVPDGSPKIPWCGNSGNHYSCMVCNCFWEADAEPIEGKIMATRSVIGRAVARTNAWPNSPCDVVFQRSQYSWTVQTDGKGKKKRDYSIPAGHQCNDAVKKALARKGPLPDHYHATWIKTPVWARSMKSIGTVGDHIFYSKMGASLNAPVDIAPSKSSKKSGKAK